jgi:hypothetical protein
LTNFVTLAFYSLSNLSLVISTVEMQTLGRMGAYMFKESRRHVLLLVFFLFVFVYRLLLLLWQTYPPGADIGFHAGLINSIQAGNANLLWNPYQMGGEVSLEFPGYHLFVSVMMVMTGIPNYLAQAVVVAVFSSLTVLSAFLVTRIVWSESAAFVVTIFVSLSWFDVEILSWSGYPNIIALFLIPLIFYCLLKKDSFKPVPFLVSTSFLVAALFLTHSLSAAVFVCITALTLLIVLIFPRVFDESRKSILFRALPIFTGALLVSPFLASAVSPYLNDTATFTGATGIIQALLATRMVPLETVLALFVCIIPFFLLSKKYKGRFFSFPVLLLVMWLIVPLLLTQGYLVGFYVDYIRFLYFLIMPLIILFAVIADYVSRYFAKILDARYGQNTKTSRSFITLRSRILARINFKTVYVTSLIGLMLILIFVLPILLTPWQGFKVRNYYQAMNEEGYQAIEWIEQNTPADAVFVSDHDYGWWLAGFGQRPTLTKVNLESLALAREADISKNASYLLDTDYMIDNGYIQVREDGGYIGRHNPMFLANLNWTNSPYGFFYFNSSEVTLHSQESKSISVAELPVISMRLVNADSDSPSIIVNKGNSNVSYSEIITVTKGKLFANMTIIIECEPDASLDYLTFVINSASMFQQSFDNTLVMLDSTKEVCGQLIFVQTQPEISNSSTQDSGMTQLSYSLEGKSVTEIQILVGIYAVSEGDQQNLTDPFGLGGASITDLQALIAVPDLPITTFDYKVALQEYNISYIANRDFELNPKYAADPAFSLAFINTEVAIFKVEANATLAKG